MQKKQKCHIFIDLYDWVKRSERVLAKSIDVADREMTE